MGRLGCPLGPSGGLPRRLGGSRHARCKNDKHEQNQSHGTQIQQNRNLLHVGRKPVPCNKPVYETKMKQKHHLLHFQASNLLHVRKTHKTIHVTNQCMKQKLNKTEICYIGRIHARMLFFLTPPGTAPRFSKARPFGGCEVGRGTWRGVDCGARCGAGRASQIAGEGAAPLLTAPPARTGGARGAGRDKCVAHGGSRRVDRSSQPRSHLRLARMR